MPNLAATRPRHLCIHQVMLWMNVLGRENLDDKMKIVLEMALGWWSRGFRPRVNSANSQMEVTCSQECNLESVNGILDKAVLKENFRFHTRGFILNIYIKFVVVELNDHLFYGGDYTLCFLPTKITTTVVSFNQNVSMISCMCMSCDGLAFLTSWGSVLWASGGVEVLLMVSLHVQSC